MRGIFADLDDINLDNIVTIPILEVKNLSNKRKLSFSHLQKGLNVYEPLV